VALKVIPKTKLQTVSHVKRLKREVRLIYYIYTLSYNFYKNCLKISILIAFFLYYNSINISIIKKITNNYKKRKYINQIFFFFFIFNIYNPSFYK